MGNRYYTETWMEKPLDGDYDERFKNYEGIVEMCVEVGGERRYRYIPEEGLELDVMVRNRVTLSECNSGYDTIIRLEYSGDVEKVGVNKLKECGKKFKEIIKDIRSTFKKELEEYNKEMREKANGLETKKVFTGYP